MKASSNPYRSSRLDTLPFRFLDAGEREMMARLRELHFRAAIVGPEGSGKTTLLEHIASRLPACGMDPVSVRLRREERSLPRLPSLTHRHALLVDGAEALPRLDWLRLRARARRAGALLITSHRPGLLPTLFQCRTTPELLRDLACSLASPPCDMDDLYERHGGNIRNALRELYDRYATLPDP